MNGSSVRDKSRTNPISNTRGIFFGTRRRRRRRTARKKKKCECDKLVCNEINSIEIFIETDEKLLDKIRQTDRERERKSRRRRRTKF